MKRIGENKYYIRYHMIILTNKKDFIISISNKPMGVTN